jgi:hypothetical protein
MSDPNAYYLDPISAPVDNDPGLTTVGIVTHEEAVELSNESGNEVYFPEEEEDAYIISEVNDEANPYGPSLG